jgi:hypothetical protein
MKKTLEDLPRILEFLELDPERMYSIAFDSSQVTFQGHYDSDIVKLLQGKGFKFEINDMGHCKAEQLSEEFKTTIRIVLT